MAITYGFYNSTNGDRKYNAVQLSSIFDGIINDGIFASIGTAMVVKSAEDMVVTVGAGRAWFNHSWTLNDAPLPITIDQSEVLLNRIDTVVLDVNATEAVRANAIMVIKGTPSSVPVPPTLIKDNDHNQYPLCNIYVGKGVSSITQSDITNFVGTESTPFITGILQTISLDELLGQWEDELDQFVANEKEEFNVWFDQMKADLTQEQSFLDEWIASEQADFLAWYEEMKGQLSEDPAGHLQLQIDKEEIRRILLVGFVDGSKVFSDDGTVISSTSSDGRTLTKTFTDGFLTMTNVLKSSTGADIAKMVKTFDSSGKLIDTVVTYF